MPKEELILDHEVALKKKKKNKIIALIMLGIVVILAVAIIVAACINVNLKPYLVGKPDRIAIYNQTQQYGEFDTDEQKYASFMQRFDDMFEASFLVSLFSGRLGDYTITGQSENITLSDTLKELQAGYYVEFKYDTPQTLTYNDGSPYYDIYNKNQTLSFTSLYFALSESNSLQTLSIYAGVKYSDGDSATTYTVRIAQKANTFGIYDNLSEYRTF